MTLLVGEGLTFGYRKHTVLHDVDVAMSPGKVVALVGASGSGKTTLLWLLAGLLQPHAGRILVRDGSSDLPLSKARPVLGMVFQQPALWDHLTIEQHLHLVLTNDKLDRRARRGRIDEILAAMRLKALAQRRPGQLSGGERQRVAIARALVANPRWLLLDEPLAHLDGASRGELFDLLARTLADTAAGVIIASHQAAEAMRVAHEVIVLEEGRVLQSGPCEDVDRHPVSLAAARALGPAWEIAGVANEGTLYAGDVPALAGIDESLAGPTCLILRPGDIRFDSDPLGPATVTDCRFAAGVHHLRIEVAGVRVEVESDEQVSPSATGRLRLA